MPRCWSENPKRRRAGGGLEKDLRVLVLDRRRYLLAETAIGSGMNIAMSLVATCVSTGGTFGAPTVAGMLPPTFMVAFMSVFVATSLTRLRRRRGQFARGDAVAPRFSRLMPHGALLRALLAGGVCVTVMAPIIGTMLPVLRASGPEPAEVIVATAAYTLLLSLLITPAALILALDDDLPAVTTVRR